MSEQVDGFYTPDWVAHYVAGLMPRGTTRVVDLAAGGGALLRAAELYLESPELVAVDSDRRAVRRLRKENPNWVHSCANSLSEESLRSTTAFRQRGKGYDAALLNPPFSYRGQARMEVRYANRIFRVTPATAFVLKGLDWIHRDGVVIAIVPRNAMEVLGDRELWQEWRAEFRVECVRMLGRNTFSGTRTASMVVVLSPARHVLRKSVKLAARKLRSDLDCVCLEVVRGRVPVHRSRALESADGTPFVHTTNLQGGMVKYGELRLCRSLETAGRLLLIPRVGALDRRKIVPATDRDVVLSDCVIGVRGVQDEVLEYVYEAILERFDEFRELYSGSCAPYLTVERFAGWLESQGFSVRQKRASAPPAGLCECRTSMLALA